MRVTDDRPFVITSRNHAAIQQIRSLQHRSEREHSGLFFTEGLRFVAQAVEQRWGIESVLLSRPLLTHAFGRRLLREVHRRRLRVVEVTPEVFHSIASVDDPQGIGAVVRQQWEPMSTARPDEGLCWVCLGTVQSPGNLGTIVRTCEAVGASGLILLGSGADPFDPSAVRSSMGALFSLRFARSTPAELAAWKRRHACALIGTSAAATEDYHRAAYPEPMALFMGWERQGLSAEEQALCDRLVRIPMVGRSDSLNVAVATGVMLYEIYNQRRTA